jgi:hypothetical protein
MLIRHRKYKNPSCKKTGSDKQSGFQSSRIRDSTKITTASTSMTTSTTTSKKGKSAKKTIQKLKKQNEPPYHPPRRNGIRVVQT